MLALCQALGAIIVASALEAKHADGQDKLVVLVPEEIDDEGFERQIAPKLEKDGIIPAALRSSERNRVSIVYHSWVIESIAANMVASLTNFRLGATEE